MAKQETKIVISAVDRATAVFRKVSNAAKGMKINTPSFGGGGSIVAALGGGAALAAIAKTSDAMAGLGARFEDAFGSVAAGNAALSEVYERSQMVGASFQDMSASVARLAPAYAEIGRPATEAIDAAQTLSTMLRMNGASAAETSSAMLQFAQAMGSGKLAGDELKALAESSPVFMRTLASSLGTTSGQLKEMGAQGLLTSDVIANALAGSFDKFNEKAKNLPKTFGSTFQRAQNTFSLFIGKLEQTGAFKSLLTSADSLLQKFDQFTNDPMKMESLAQTIKSVIDAFVSFAPAIATVTVAVIAYNSALNMMSIASTVASKSSLVLFRGFGLLKGGLSSAVLGLRNFAVASKLSVAANGGLAGSFLTMQSAGTSLIGVFRALGAAMLANPLGLVIGLIAGFVAIVASAYSYSEPLRNSLGQLWGALSRLAEAFGISGSFGDNFSKVMGFIGDSISIAIDKITAFIGAITKAVNWVKEFAGFGGGANVNMTATQKVATAAPAQATMPAVAKPAAAVAQDKTAIAQFNSSIQTNAQAASKNLTTAVKDEQTAAKDATTTQTFNASVNTFASVINSLPSQIASALSNVSVNVNMAGGNAPSRSSLPTGAMA